MVAHAVASAVAFSGAQGGEFPLLSRLLHPDAAPAQSVYFWANALLSCTLLAALALRIVFLGQLTAAEASNAGERLLAWALLRVVTIAAVLRDPDTAELLVWAGWSLVLGVLRILSGLAKDRFETQTSNVAVTRLEQARSAGLLLTLFLLTGAMALLALHAVSDRLTLWLLLHDTLTLSSSLVLLCVRCGCHLHEASQLAAEALPSGERRRSLLFVTDFVLEAWIDLLSLAHSATLYWLHGLSLQLVDAVLLLYIRSLGLSFWQRVTRFVSFIAVSRSLQRAYANVTSEELNARDEDCAICREKLDRGKRLPCDHVFHAECLQRWMEVKTACPTCRRPLGWNA